MFGSRKTKKVTTTLTLLTILTFTVALSTNLATASNPTEIEITNLSGQKTTLTYNQILVMPNTTEYAELYCYGTIVTSGQWTGIKISELLNSTNADLTAKSIEFTAQDGYKVSLPMEGALLPDTILAFAKDGSPLAETYRLVLPGVNGNLWISLVSSMALSDASATSTANSANGPAINLHQNLFTKSTGQISQTNQPSPTPTIKQPTPSPSASILETPAPTSLPSATDTIPNSHSLPSPMFSSEWFYGTIAAIIIAIVLGGVVIKRKRQKTEV